MSRLLLYVLAAITLATTAAAQVDAERIHRENVGAVLVIEGLRADGQRTVQGSGVCVDRRGYVLATAHQTEGVASYRGRLEDGRQFTLEAVAVDRARELALFRAETALPVAAPIGDASGLANGAPLVSIAAPLNLEYSTVTGTVASTARELGGEPVIQANLTATHGSSGGPVFDRHGALIGIIRGELEEAEFTLICPINRAYPMLQNFGVIAAPEAAEREEVLVPVPGVSEAELRAVQAYNHGVRATAPEEKAEAYAMAVRLLPAFFEAWYNLGVARTGLEDSEGAEAAYYSAAKLRPDSIQVQRNLGRLLRNAGRLEDAAQVFEAALALAPDDPQACNDLGVIYRQLEDYDAAEQALRRAVELAPDYAAAHFNLGLTCAARGDAAEAIRHLEQYLQLAPDADDAPQVRASIAQLRGEGGNESP